MEYTKAYEFDVKQIDEREDGTFEGYASVFGGPPDLQGDIVRRGAFTPTLNESQGKVPILMGHVMARIVGFGIEAEEDKKGLHVIGQFTLESDEGRNAYAVAKHAVKLKHKLGLSIGYGIREGGSEFNDKTGIRTLTALDLYEYSIAAVPAAPRARMANVKCETLREAERFLRQCGMSHDEARQFISLCKAERDVKPNDNDDPERDVKDLDRGAHEAFMAALRQQSIIHEMRKGF